MKKTKGFTLIELLATIVILGLLALIVTPGIAKVIRNSKINTAKASLEGYVREIENAVALYMTDTGSIPNSIDQLEIDGKNIDKIGNPNVVFNSDGTISKITATVNDFKCAYIENNGVACFESDYLPEIAFDNTKCATTLTTTDEITAMNNKLDTCVNASGTITHTGTIESTNGTYNIVYTVTDIYGNTNTLTKTFTVELPTNPSITYENFGDEIYYDPVNDVVGCTTYTESNSASGVIEGCLKWHVLSENEDGSVNLILDHNIVSDVQWYSSEDNSQGPTVAKEALNNAIKDKWSANLVRTDSYSHTFHNGTENKTYTVSYNGMKARLPEAQEIANAVGHTWDEDTATSKFYFDSKNQTQTVGYDKDVKTSSYAWLFNNLNKGSIANDASDNKTCLYCGCTQNLGKTSGDNAYWTSTSVRGSTSSAWDVRYIGNLNYISVADTRGVSPVITLN